MAVPARHERARIGKSGVLGVGRQRSRRRRQDGGSDRCQSLGGLQRYVVANTTQPVGRPMRKSLGETPAPLGLVVLAADEHDRPRPREKEVLAVSSAMECAHALCDGRSSNLLRSSPCVLHDIRRGVGCEEWTPVPLPGDIDALNLEEIDGLVAQVGFGTVTGFGSAQDESLDLGWGEHGDFDCARSTDRVPHHDDWAAANCVECGEGPRSEVVTLAVKRRSDAVVDERPQIVREDRSVQRERMQQKQLHVTIIADASILPSCRDYLVPRMGRAVARPKRRRSR